MQLTCEVIGSDEAHNSDSEMQSPRTRQAFYSREMIGMGSEGVLLGDANTLGRSPRDGYVGLEFPWIEGGGKDLIIARRVERARRVLLQEQSRTLEFVRIMRCEKFLIRG